MNNGSTEIERKFLLVGEPPGLFTGRSYAIKQGYLTIGPGREIRLRRRDDDCFLTIKDGTGLERDETELPISRVQFDLLWPLTHGRRIEKTRHLLPWNELTVEADIYQSSLAPLRVAEIEFRNRAQSEKFAKPPFLGREVTGQPEYSNAYLASFGAPTMRNGQIGCVPFLLKGGELHIVLVRSSSGQRWIVPKGQREAGMTPVEVALMEGAEEGGVVGTIHEELHTNCALLDGREVRLYALHVVTVLKRWPEENSRKRAIFPWKEAVASIDDKALALSVEKLAQRFLVERI